MSKIRIGIIGSGGTGTRHAERFSEMETVEVVAIASRNTETGNVLAEKHGAEFIPDWQALVQRDNLDGVVICTHNDTHAEIALAALRCDKHIFMEYPLARSIDAGEAVVEAAQSNQRVLRINHSETVSNSHRAIKQKAQGLGDLLLTTFSRLTPGRGVTSGDFVQSARFRSTSALFRLSHLPDHRSLWRRQVGRRLRSL